MSTKEFPTSGVGDRGLWSLVFILFEISPLVPLSTHGRGRTLPWHTPSLPCKKQFITFCSLCLAVKWVQEQGAAGCRCPSAELCSSLAFCKGHMGTGHQDRAWADEPRTPQISGGAEPVAQGQAVFLEVAGWQQSLAMGCINEL